MAQITRRGLLQLLTVAGAQAQSSRATQPFNIVLILADDLGWADLGCYGSDLHETPNIDRLAREGVRFTQAMSASPVCSPTRASIMTGKHPARLGITIWHEGAVESQRPPAGNRKLIQAVSESNLPLQETTLAEVLRDGGYRTASVGKWHLGTAAFAPETQGFDVNVGGTHWGAPATFFHPFRGAQRFGGEYRFVPGLGFGKPGDYLTDRLTDEAIRVIDEASPKPFFLYLAHHAPHTPIEGKAELVAKYKAKVRPGMRHRNPVYAAMIESLDESVGRLRDHLRRRGIDRNTVILFASDNGGYLKDSGGQEITTNHPLRSGKGSLYEGGVRVPLIAYWPGVTKGGSQTCDEPVVSTDLFRTICELAGKSAPQSANDGHSLVSLLRDPKSKLDRDEFFFHYPHYYPTTTPVSALRTREWKLIHYYEGDRYELFDLGKDPGEQQDVAGSNPRVVERLRSRLETWKRDTGARVPRSNPQSGK
jgi:arylsulfatase A-like enzyme